jgi:hypothetical protein
MRVVASFEPQILKRRTAGNRVVGAPFDRHHSPRPSVGRFHNMLPAIMPPFELQGHPGQTDNQGMRGLLNIHNGWSFSEKSGWSVAAPLHGPWQRNRAHWPTSARWSATRPPDDRRWNRTATAIGLRTSERCPNRNSRFRVHSIDDCRPDLANLATVIRRNGLDRSKIGSFPHDGSLIQTALRLEVSGNLAPSRPGGHE